MWLVWNSLPDRDSSRYLFWAIFTQRSFNRRACNNLIQTGLIFRRLFQLVVRKHGNFNAPVLLTTIVRFV